VLLTKIPLQFHRQPLGVALPGTPTTTYPLLSVGHRGNVLLINKLLQFCRLLLGLAVRGTPATTSQLLSVLI